MWGYLGARGTLPPCLPEVWSPAGTTGWIRTSPCSLLWLWQSPTGLQIRLAPPGSLEMPKKTCSLRLSSPSNPIISTFLKKLSACFPYKLLVLLDLTLIVSAISLLVPGFWFVFLLILGWNVHFELCGMLHNSNPSAPGAQWGRQNDNSGPAWATQWDPILKPT